MYRLKVMESNETISNSLSIIEDMVLETHWPFCLSKLFCLITVCDRYVHAFHVSWGR